MLKNVAVKGYSIKSKEKLCAEPTVFKNLDNHMVYVFKKKSKRMTAFFIFQVRSDSVPD